MSSNNKVRVYMRMCMYMKQQFVGRWMSRHNIPGRIITISNLLPIWIQSASLKNTNQSNKQTNEQRNKGLLYLTSNRFFFCFSLFPPNDTGHNGRSDSRPYDC